MRELKEVSLTKSLMHSWWLCYGQLGRTDGRAIQGCMLGWVELGRGLGKWVRHGIDGGNGMEKEEDNNGRQHEWGSSDGTVPYCTSTVRVLGEGM